MCQCCHKEVDTLAHYFVYGADVVIFWKQFAVYYQTLLYECSTLYSRKVTQPYDAS